MSTLVPRHLAFVAGLALVAGCSEQPTVPAPVPATATNIVRTHCVADVRTLTVQCGAGEVPALAGTLSTTSGQGFQPTQRLGAAHIFGGQGVYVNLVSSGVTYVSQVFSFNATVQNITNLPMATSNGTTRDDAGLQVFIHSGPTMTSGSGTVTVNNATGVGTFLVSNQSYYQYGGKISGTDQGELGADGILSSTETSSAKNWQFGVPASVTSFTFDVYVSTQTSAGAVSSVAPQVTSIAPATLVPGASATITGTSFSATPANNTVTIGGQAAAVTAASTTSLTVTVPCVLSGSQPVYVTTSGTRGAAFSHPLAVTQRTVAVGQALVLTTSSASACNELPSAGGVARYVVSVFNVNSSPSNNAPFQFSADNREPAPAVSAQVAPATVPALRSAAERARDAAHTRLLDQNAEAYQRLRARFGSGAGVQVSRSVQSRFMPPPATRTFRVSNLNATSPNDICNSFYVVSATLVYSNGKLAIYEDDATPNAFKSGLNATMAGYYQSIGDQFNADMEPIITANFGNVLRRDAVLDNNGVVIALFTPLINNSFSGRAGFVVSCDQYPNDDASSPAVGGPYTGSVGSTNGASNFGEVFYAEEPTDVGTSYSGNMPPNWYRSVRSTFIHETKHLAAYAARVANGAGAFEVSWLEEGTARHSEELWMRNAVDNVAWKGNTGYGSLGTPINVYCDVRTAGGCATGKRPASIMYNHFSALWTFMSGGNPSLMSPFGPSPSDNGGYFYGISWSLVRYALDRYGASDAAFLTALTQATTTGATNLTARAGVSIDQLLGGWSMMLYADDHASIASPSVDIQMPTWNLRNIFAGLNADFSGTFTPAYPLVPTPLSFGTSSPLTTATLRGGALKFFEFSGTQTAAQLLRVDASGGGTLPSDLRIAIVRVQ